MVGTHLDVTEQYFAKEALQNAFNEIKKSEDRLRLVIDTIPTLVWRAGPEGIPRLPQSTSPRLYRPHIGPRRNGWPRAFHPDDKKSMLQKWSAIRQSGGQASLKHGSVARMVNIAGSCSAPSRCAIVRQHYQMVWFVYRHRGPQADRGRTSRERAALSRLCRNRFRLALGERTRSSGDHGVGAP